MNEDRRYTMRLRSVGLDGGDSFSTDIFQNAEEGLGVWDTVEKCFVKRDPITKEWVPES
jgi:hypothetical protein